MADKFEDLRTFITVMAAGGINAAASELGIAKSAVSRRLSDLEKRLGVSLVERTSRRFKATPIGLEYERRARGILQSLEDLDALAAPTKERRDVTISAAASMITYVLVPAAEKVHVKLEGERLLFRFVHEHVVDDHEAVDIIVTDRVSPNRKCRELLSTRSMLCASPDYLSARGCPYEIGQLDQHSAIVIDDGTPAAWRLGDQTRAIERTAIVTPDEHAAAAAAVAGLGLAQLPDFVVADALAGGRLIRVLPKEGPRPRRMFACYRADADPAVRVTVDAFADALSAEAKK